MPLSAISTGQHDRRIDDNADLAWFTAGMVDGGPFHDKRALGNDHDLAAQITKLPDLRQDRLQFAGGEPQVNALFGLADQVLHLVQNMVPAANGQKWFDHGPPRRHFFLDLTQDLFKMTKLVGAELPDRHRSIARHLAVDLQRPAPC